jgi:hypothetical protein
MTNDATVLLPLRKIMTDLKNLLRSSVVIARRSLSKEATCLKGGVLRSG